MPAVTPASCTPRAEVSPRVRASEAPSVKSATPFPGPTARCKESASATVKAGTRAPGSHTNSAVAQFRRTVRDTLLRHERSRDVDASVAVLRLIADPVGRLANALHHLRNVQTAALRDEQGGKPRDVRRRRARSVGPEIEVLVTGAYRCVAAARAEDHLGKQLSVGRVPREVLVVT